jgi:hypothetical protein
MRWMQELMLSAGPKSPDAEFCIESVTKVKAGLLASRGVMRSQAQHVRDLLELRLFRPTCCPGIIMVSLPREWDPTKFGSVANRVVWFVIHRS